MNERYLEPTQESGAELFSRGIEGEVVMLNLMRFRLVADYSLHPELKPSQPVSGREAYRLYMMHTLPLLRKRGGDLLFMGDGGPYLIGPPDEHWDMAMLVRQRSLQDFIAFASDEEYLAGLGHRTAAVLDSRLLPLVEFNDIDALAGS